MYSGFLCYSALFITDFYFENYRPVFDLMVMAVNDGAGKNTFSRLDGWDG